MSDSSKFGLKWNRQELMLAINLYCKIPFGKISSRHPDIIELAGLLGRTPSSVGLKLANLAAIDPTIPQKGLVNAGKLDRQVWDDFFSDRDSHAYESEKMLAKLKGTTLDNILKEIDPLFTIGEGWEAETLMKTRVNQYLFRRTVLTSYKSRCCITGLDIPELLVASHIVPWSKGIHRLNPANGLCLNALHDRAFDRGLITIDNDFKVVVSRNAYGENNKDRHLLQKYHGKTIFPPERFAPNQDFLEYHRQNIFSE